MRRPVCRTLFCVPLLLLITAAPVQGQVLRSVVVPADTALAVPPRGQPLPAHLAMPGGMPAGDLSLAPASPALAARAPMAGPRTSLAAEPAPVAASRPGLAAAPPPAAVPPEGLAAASGVWIPLAAAVLLGGALAGGGGGGTGAPAVTR